MSRGIVGVLQQSVDTDREEQRGRGEAQLACLVIACEADEELASVAPVEPRDRSIRETKAVRCEVVDGKGASHGWRTDEVKPEASGCRTANPTAATSSTAATAPIAARGMEPWLAPKIANR